MTKTNAMRMLDRAKIKYDVLQYDYDESDLSGVHAAAALSLDPLGAFLVGGVGAFLGDFFFYPLPMFVSLATH